MTIPTVLIGGETVFGTAQDNTGTDSFLDSGAGNTIIEGGGNLDVLGGYIYPYGYDSQTTVYLQNAAFVNDQIHLDGAQNTVASTAGSYLYQSSIAVTVSGVGVVTAGSNTVSLDNIEGNTGVTLTGRHNTVALNGNATNMIATGLGYAAVSVGNGTYDSNFGYTTTLKLGGSYNTLAGGDENFTVKGGVSYNTAALGDGDNTLTFAGTKNTISVGGGSNIISAGSGSDTVNLLGTDGDQAATWIYAPGVPIFGPPTDTINLAGNNDSVYGTYENVIINGSNVGGAAKINLGNGNDSMTLGGNADAVTLGYGDNGVFLTGNNDRVTVTDPNGVGTDNVSVGNGTGDVISLDHAAGSLSGSTFGNVTLTQASGATTTVNVNLPNGTGLISVGNGNDTLLANGPASVIVAGNGADVVTANGTSSTVTLGSGADFVNANGNGASVTAGNGNDYVNANGNDSNVVLGSGNDTVNSMGTGSAVTIAAVPGSLDTVNVGSGDLVRVTNGTSTINGVAGNSFYLNGLQANSSLLLSGNSNMAFIGSDSSVVVGLNQAQSGTAITVQADAGNTYAGNVILSEFNNLDSLTLNGLVGGLNGQSLNSYAEVLQNISAGPFSDTLHLAGGGAITFAAVTGFTQNEFHFGTTTGHV